MPDAEPTYAANLPLFGEYAANSSHKPLPKHAHAARQVPRREHIFVVSFGLTDGLGGTFGRSLRAMESEAKARSPG